MSRGDVHQVYKKADGTVVDSVTTVLAANLGWSTEALLGWTRSQLKRGLDPLRTRDKAGESGTVAHGLIEQALTGNEFNIFEYPADSVTLAQEAFSGWEAFAAIHDIEVVHCEIPIVHEDLCYGGTIDLIAKIDGVLTLMDFKTSNSLHVSHKIQLSAYSKLYEYQFDTVPEQSQILHLSKRDGSYALHTIEDLTPFWRVFELLLELDKWRVLMTE